MSRLRVRYTAPPPPPTYAVQSVMAPGGYPPSTTTKVLTLPSAPRLGSLILIGAVSFLDDPPIADPQIVDLSSNNGGSFQRDSLLPHAEGYVSDASLSIFSHVPIANSVAPYQITYTVPAGGASLYMAWGAIQIDAYPQGAANGLDDETHFADPSSPPPGAYTTDGPIAPGTVTPTTAHTLVLMIGANRGHNPPINVVHPGAPWVTELNEAHNSDPTISIHFLWQLTTSLSAITPELTLVNSTTGLPPQETTGVRSALAAYRLQ